MKRFALVMVLACGVAFAQETIVSYDDNSLPVLNEELRKIDVSARATKATTSAVKARLDAIESRLDAIEKELGIQ